MFRSRILLLAVLALVGSPWATAQAGVFIGVGFAYPHRYYYRPWYGPRVIVAPPPVIIAPAPAPVYVAPAPVYVQPAPAYAPPPMASQYAPAPAAAPAGLPPAPVPVQGPGQ